jgi:hypothetical protein
MARLLSFRELTRIVSLRDEKTTPRRKRFLPE